MLKSITALSLLLVAVTAPARGADDPAAADLRPHFQAGRVARYAVWTQREQAINMSVDGKAQPLATSMRVDGEITWSVDRVRPDGSATCTMTLDWIALAVTGPDGTTQQNDSRRGGGEADPVQALVRAMAGVPVKIEVAADGTILNSTGADTVNRRAGGKMKTPDDLDYMETANDLAAVAAAPLLARLNQGWDAAFAWNHELGRLIEPMRYTLVSLEEIAGIPVATVYGAAPLRLELDPSKLPAAPAAPGVPAPKIDIRMTAGRLSTQIMFDMQRHEAVGRNTMQETRVEAKIRVENHTLLRTTVETTQSQALRIEER